MDVSQTKKSKPSGDFEALLGCGSPELSDSDEESKEDVPDDMDDVFTMKTMDDTMLPTCIRPIINGVGIKPLFHSPRISEKTVSCQFTAMLSWFPASLLGRVCPGGIALLQDILFTSIPKARDTLKEDPAKNFWQHIWKDHRS